MNVLSEFSGDHPARIVWRSFLVNPAMPDDGMERNAWLTRVFGNARVAEVTLERVTQQGLAEGIPFAFSAIARVPSALRAQALILGVERSDRQDDMINSIFKNHFVAGRDIGDRGVLADIAGCCGINRAEALALIDNLTIARRLLHDTQAAMRGGIRSVPFLVFNRCFAVSGAQSTEVLRRLVTTTRECAQF